MKGNRKGGRYFPIDPPSFLSMGSLSLLPISPFIWGNTTIYPQLEAHQVSLSDSLHITAEVAGVRCHIHWHLILYSWWAPWHQEKVCQHRWLAIVQQWIGVTIYKSHDKSVDPCHLWGIYSHVTAKGKIPEVTKARCTKVVIRMMAWWQYKLDGHSLMIIQQISEIVNQKSMNGEDLL